MRALIAPKTGNGGIEMPSPAQAAVSSIRAGWDLGNTLDAVKCDVGPGESLSPREAETAWHNPPVTRVLIRAVKDAGFDALRLPVTWFQHLLPSGGVDPAWMDRVEEITGWALEEGLYCFLNVHHDAGAHGWLQADTLCLGAFGERFEALWHEIASRFASVGEKLVFEAFNEMLDGREHWTETGDDAAYEAHLLWHQRFVDAVRSAGGMNESRLLSLQTYSAGHSPRTLDHFRMPSDPAPGRIILQVHTYDPQGFCWRRAEGHELRTHWGTEADRALADRLMADLSAFAKRQGAPLVIGEFGSEDKQNTPDRVRHAAYYAQRGREAGIPCFWWDCGHFALIDRTACRVIHPDIVEALCGR